MRVSVEEEEGTTVFLLAGQLTLGDKVQGQFCLCLRAVSLLCLPAPLALGPFSPLLISEEEEEQGTALWLWCK